MAKKNNVQNFVPEQEYVQEVRRHIHVKIECRIVFIVNKKHETGKIYMRGSEVTLVCEG